MPVVLLPSIARAPRALIVVLLCAGVGGSTGGCQSQFVAPEAAASGTKTLQLPITREGDDALTRHDLLDARTCGSCHSEAYIQWQQSPHASAADDPVFLAMNKMAQRETHGAIGSFCVQCHAPMALREGKTTDGLNLHEVPQALKGVTCYFCHDAKSVVGSHNNKIELGNDLVMRGPVRDARSNAAHQSLYQTLQDRNTLSSSSLCGSCHDVVTPPGAALESTYAEWQASVFAHKTTGQSCGGCHMSQSAERGPISDDAQSPARYRHAHDFAGLDLPLPGSSDSQPAVVQDAAVAKAHVQSLLDRSLQTAVCVKQVGNRASLRVVLDNVGAGHAFSSGAVQDRRIWVEVQAFKQGRLIYQSGVVPEGEPVMKHVDDDLWLIRSCMYDRDGRPTNHFWQAASIDSNPLPTITTFNTADPNFYRSNVVRRYPDSLLGSLTEVPDKVTMRVLIEPIGLDLLDELVASRDLDPAVRAAAQRLVVGPTQVLTWTPETATTGYQEHGVPVSCASLSNVNLTGLLFEAKSHAHCDLRSPQ